MVSPDVISETIVFYWVGVLTLHPTPKLEDQDFISGFTPLETLFVRRGLSGLSDYASSYTPAGIAPSP
jgi:hypothetical protein